LCNHFTAVLVSGLRDYGVEGQFGLEKTPEEYVAKMVEVFREVKRVLKKEGAIFLNLGDSYMSGGGASRHAGYNDPKWPKARDGGHIEPTAFPHPTIKPKDLVGIPWRVAFALQSDGWYLRQDLIWHKPNPMPESVTDRCTKSHEYIFLMAKSQKYYFDNEAIKEPSVDKESYEGMRKRSSDKRENDKFFATKVGNNAEGKTYETRNKRSVWTVTTKPFKEAHFATFPEDLIVPMVKAGCPENGLVLDCFMGAGTTALVAKKLKRNYLGIELNPAYIKIAENRLRQDILI
jgi:DNA modification methylase